MKHAIEETPLERFDRLISELTGEDKRKWYTMYVQSKNGYGVSHVGWGGVHRQRSPIRLLGHYKGVRVVSIDGY